MITSGSSGEIRQYTPKSRSGKSLRVTDLRKSQSLQRSDETEEAIDEIRRSVTADQKTSQEVTKEILSTVPKIINKGTIGESLYGCAIPQGKDVALECTPECLNGIPLTSTKKCKSPIYVKDNGKLTKVNNVKGEDAVVFISDQKGSLTQEDLESLMNDNVLNVSTFTRSEDQKYKKSTEYSTSSTSSSRTSSSSSSSSSTSASRTSSSSEGGCAPKPQSQTEESSSSEECPLEPSNPECLKPKDNCGYGWVYAIVAVVFLIILAIAVCWMFGCFSSSTSSSCPEPKKECVPQQPKECLSKTPDWC